MEIKTMEIKSPCTGLDWTGHQYNDPHELRISRVQSDGEESEGTWSSSGLQMSQKLPLIAGDDISPVMLRILRL